MDCLILFFFFLMIRRPPRSTPFPTRRSSDLWIIEVVAENLEIKRNLLARVAQFRKPGAIVTTNTSGLPVHFIDRKSTRLNSSHLVISYAVFCLKKKKQHNHIPNMNRPSYRSV